MDLFGFKKSYIGVDLGTSAIKMVELQNKGGRALLLTYGYSEQPTDIIRSSSTEMEDKIIKIIKGIYSKSRMSSKKVIAALPSFSVFSSIINLPLMNKKDLAQAVQWEARKFIPLPIEEMTLDWKIIPPPPAPAKEAAQPKNEARPDKPAEASPSLEPSSPAPPVEPAKSSLSPGAKIADLAKKTDQPASPDSARPQGKPDAPSLSNPGALFSKMFHRQKKDAGPHQNITGAGKKNNIKILLTAAPKNLVEKYIRIFKAADLELLSLETEAFALERSLSGGDPAPIMIIDIGAVSSDVSIIDNGIPILTRSIDVGGVAITKSVMTSLNVDLARAEQFKRDIGFSASGPGDLPEIIKSTINPIINEVKYCLDIYLSQGSLGGLEKIILTGGSAFLPELITYFTKLLDIKVIIGDPWDRVIYPLELKPVLTELGPRFTIAVGLAMREI